MEREEIEKVLCQNDSTVLSFPNRGPWGNNRYRGNNSGWYQAFCIWKYNVKFFSELFAGGGTGYDVAKDMGISYIGADLNPTPVRDKILSVNAITDDVPDEFYGTDFLFMHPPYGKEIGIPYAGSMYTDPTGELSKSDLGQMPWDVFIKTLNEVVMKYYAALETNAKIGILMGDVRRNGNFYSMLTDIVKPGKMEQIIIKTQHNCMSDGREYSKRNFVPIVHEYLMILKKVGSYIINFNLQRKFECDVRDSKASWTTIIVTLLRAKGSSMRLEEFYDALKGHKKCDTNNFYKEKIRQVLQNKNLFTRIDVGVYALKNIA